MRWLMPQYRNSRKTELKLVGVARASLEELLLDYQDLLRQRGLKLWEKDHPRAKEVRGLVYKPDRSFQTRARCPNRFPAKIGVATLL